MYQSEMPEQNTIAAKIAIYTSAIPSSPVSTTSPMMSPPWIASCRTDSGWLILSRSRSMWRARQTMYVILTNSVGWMYSEPTTWIQFSLPFSPVPNSLTNTSSPIDAAKNSHSALVISAS